MGEQFPGGGYLNFRDMIDGGGAGQRGDRFQGGGGYSQIANLFATPLGSQRQPQQQQPGQPMAPPMRPMQPPMQASQVPQMRAPQPAVTPLQAPPPVQSQPLAIAMAERILNDFPPEQVERIANDPAMLRLIAAQYEKAAGRSAPQGLLGAQR